MANGRPLDMTESNNPPRTASTVVVLVIGAALGVAAALIPSCAHLDTGARVAASMAEHCGPELSEDERRECMESYLAATLECAAQHVPEDEPAVEPAGETGGVDSGEHNTDHESTLVEDSLH